METRNSDKQEPVEEIFSVSSQRGFAKDEAVLARYGKRQQLQVSFSHHDG